MTMEIVALPRAGGKTTLALEWLFEEGEDETRVLVTHSAAEAQRLVNEGGLHAEPWRVVPWSMRNGEHWRGRGKVVVGVENVDVILQAELRFPLGLMTMTHEEQA